MSFLSVLKTIGSDLVKGAKVALPVAETVVSFLPGGSVASTIINTVIAVEQLVTTPGSGATKKALATQIINTIHPGLPAPTIAAAVDGIVGVLNALASDLAAPAPAA